MSALGQLIRRGVLTLSQHIIRAEHHIPRGTPVAPFIPADQASLALQPIPMAHLCLNLTPVVGRIRANLEQAFTALKTIQPINGNAVGRVVSAASSYA